MVLSDRLSAAASMVTQGYRLADIGTDHAFVPIRLVRDRRIPSAIAMDVNRGPLERAREHIKEAGLDAFIQTRLSDGLRALKREEADSVLIAGMGGALTIRILQNDPPLERKVKELILQPQSEIGKVREYLCECGWKIDREDMVLEDGKYYPMMHCIPGSMQLSQEEELFGPCLIASGHPVLLKYLSFRREVLTSNLESLSNAASSKALERREELTAQLAQIRKVRERIIASGQAVSI